MENIGEVAIIVLTDRIGRVAMQFLTRAEIATKDLVSNAHMLF